MTDATFEQTIQAWGNGLGVRITAPVARAARLSRGQSVIVEVVKEGVLLRPRGRPKLTLRQKLAAFDPTLHGGEAMPGSAVGKERV